MHKSHTTTQQENDMNQFEKTKYQIVRELIREYGRREAWRRCVKLDNLLEPKGSVHFKEIYKELTFQML
jgi:hypothetical protein